MLSHSEMHSVLRYHWFPFCFSVLLVVRSSVFYGTCPTVSEGEKSAFLKTHLGQAVLPPRQT